MSGGRPRVRSCHFCDLAMRLHVQRESRDDQVVRNDAEPDPSRRAVHTSITTALQTMASLGRRPQRHVRRPRGMNLIRGDDLMFGFLDRDELAEFGRLRNLALPNGLGMRFKDLSTLSGTWTSPPIRRARV